MAPAFRKRHPMSPGEPPDEMQQNEKEPLRPLEHSAKPSVTTKTASRSCQWFRLVWAVNLLFAVVVLSVGVWRNHAAR
jgi:cytoskeletal protein RodZ